MRYTNAKTFFLIVLLHCLSINATSQWIIQSTGNTNPVRDIEFINRFTGWACGDNNIYKTTNGGTIWILQSHPGAFLIQQIFPVNENIVYAAGWWNFLKTTNGGENWFSLFDTLQTSGLPQLEGLYFINENTGWLVGNVVAMKTTNGGNSFIDSMRIEAICQDVYFKDALTGIACGEVAGFYRTTNGGHNWTTIPIIQKGALYNFFRLTTYNDSVVWLGSKSIYKSTDFGLTWDSIAFIKTIEPQAQMYSIEFSSINVGYAAGEFGEMYKSVDGGYTWTKQNTGTSMSYFRSMHAYTDSIVWASRGNGTILHTVHGGQVGISDLDNTINRNFILRQNYPNPFNPQTIISFELKRREFVTLKIFDINGKEIETLVNVIQPAGNHLVTWNPKLIASGFYVYTLKVGQFEESKKMLFLK